MSLFSRIQGVVGSFFQLGGPSAPGVKGVAGGTPAIEARNSADNAYVPVRGATPVGDNDLATRAYVDGMAYSKPVTAQISGAAAVPSNTATAHWIVVTTSGGNASIGDLYYDDGTNTGTCDKVVAKAGNSIVTTVAFSGGTISLLANQEYVWDGGSSSWINIAANVSGVTYAIEFAIGTGAAQTSTTSIPANATVLRCELTVATPFSAGTTISIGRTAATTLLMATTDNVATVAGEYDAPQRTAWGVSALPVLATVAGSPSVGAGTCTVVYTIPNT